MRIVLQSGSSEIVLRFLLSSLCLLYIKFISGKNKICTGVRLAHIHEVSVNTFNSKFLVPVPKAGEFFFDAV